MGGAGLAGGGARAAVGEGQVEPRPGQGKDQGQGQEGGDGHLLFLPPSLPLLSPSASCFCFCVPAFPVTPVLGLSPASVPLFLRVSPIFLQLQLCQFSLFCASPCVCSCSDDRGLLSLFLSLTHTLTQIPELFITEVVEGSALGL